MYKGLAVVQAVRYRTWFDTTNNYKENSLYEEYINAGILQTYQG